jgi:hypothetical protein
MSMKNLPRGHDHPVARLIQHSPKANTRLNLSKRRALCYDVGYQDALTVLVIASDWSESRGVFVWRVVV